MNNKTWELEQKISSLINNCGLPVESVYFMMKGLTSQLEIMLYQIELTNLTDPSVFEKKTENVSVDVDSNGDVIANINGEKKEIYKDEQSKTNASTDFRSDDDN